MTRWLWLAAVLLLVAFDVWCFAFQWSAVAGNTAASVIWTTPALAAHHVLTRRRQDRQHDEQMAAHAELVGRHEAHSEQLVMVAAQVRELHGLHLHGSWPEDRHQDR